MRYLVITEDTLGFYNLPKVRLTCDTLSSPLLYSLSPSIHLSSHLLFIQPIFMESLISSSKGSTNNRVLLSMDSQFSVHANNNNSDNKLAQDNLLRAAFKE